MRMVDLIEKKRDGGILTDDEIRFIIQGFTDGSIPDYQMSAFAMTVFYKGMTDHETAVLTDAMMRSGDTVTPPLVPTARSAFPPRCPEPIP